jgi:hypothetical protein
VLSFPPLFDIVRFSGSGVKKTQQSLFEKLHIPCQKLFTKKDEKNLFPLSIFFLGFVITCFCRFSA